MAKIAIIAAMDKEAEMIRKMSPAGVSVTTSGIGKVASALKTAQIIESSRPELVINSGIAGGLGQDIVIGDTVCAATACYHDVWCGTPNAYGQIQGFPLYYHGDPQAMSVLGDTVKKGLVVSGDCFVSEKTEADAIRKRFPLALAADMETAAIAQTCFIYGVPFLSLRLISDTPGIQHHRRQYEQFWAEAAEKSFIRLCEVLKRLC